MDCVKLEGGQERAETVKKIVSGGVAVMGHIGLTPQAISVLGGFRAQGRTAAKARVLVDDALALQDAGAFALVIECVPPAVADAVTEALEIPTIGIGAGPGTTGQVLVFHDMLGMCTHPHHAAFTPKFCKQFSDLGAEIRRGLEDFKSKVETDAFPSLEYSPYKMRKDEEAAFKALLEKDEPQRMLQRQDTSTRIQTADEYETLNLYGVGHVPDEGTAPS